MKTIPIPVRLDRETALRLKKVADRLHIRPGAVLRLAIATKLPEAERSPSFLLDACKNENEQNKKGGGKR